MDEKPFIITSEQLENHIKFIGLKAINQKKLSRLGLDVPAFFCLPTYSCENFDEQKLLEETGKTIKTNKFAVRSNALTEDNEKSSMAGQFLTITNLQLSEISNAAKTIIDNAKYILKEKFKDNFSLIIQEYIDPDFSGITFTRNPKIGREMVIEFHRGKGEKIVGGEIHVTENTILRNEKIPQNLKILPKIDWAIEQFKIIEKFFGHAQDIEWCIKNNNWYFLQTRPISSISKTKFEEIIFLEKHLRGKKNYLYEKSEISEIAPRPSPLTYSLLEIIYSKDGPVQNVFKKFNIKYNPINFLEIIGNELFVDRNTELECLLPAFGKKNLLKKLLKLPGTIANIYKLNKLPLDKDKILFSQIKEKLEESTQEKSIEKWLSNFRKNYELIFEINLLSSLGLNKLKTVFKENPEIIPKLMQEEAYSEIYSINFQEKLTGNTLEISDNGNFIKNTKNISDKEELEKILLKFPKWKREYLEFHIKKAAIFNRLREFGRWLTVKQINSLKNILKSEKLYYATITELLLNKYDDEILKIRKENYEKFNKYNFPDTISDKKITMHKNYGISSGTATGTLLNKENIRSHEYRGKYKILRTDILTPDLTEYFDDIIGIISNKGGLLSHLAIIGRERGLPIVISKDTPKFKEGSTIQINGDTGEIRILNN